MYETIVALPLLGFLVAGIFGRWIGPRASEIVTTSLLFVSMVLSWIAFGGFLSGDGTADVHLVTSWMTSGALRVEWALRIDSLTVVMLFVVTTVSALVHLYSIGYMHEDKSRPRFFAYLSFFTFAMLMLVTADNLVQLFFGWEGVGLASYLLIGFWYERPAANAAAIKAFIVNRIGDFGFTLGIFLVFLLTNSVAFDQIFAAAPGLAHKMIHVFGFDMDAMTITCLLLFMGAMGKSAQFLLHTWLPDAMEGPTPVSALIHAATMVTAGVFMVARLSPLFEEAPVALTFVTIIGATTAFFAATVGLVQNDIKRVVAYSTCSQLGYMFVALGVGGYSIGIFHLFTHAFFKALLFLGAGSVIHAMHHEQDMREMGGLAKKIPITFAMMLIGTLALTGFPITAGYFSKDAIIEAAYAAHRPDAFYGFVLTTVAAGLTAFYSWRLIFMTFFGRPKWARAEAERRLAEIQPQAEAPAGHAAASIDSWREPDLATRQHDDHDSHHDAHHVDPHESPNVMLIPLYVLAVGSLFAGLVFARFFLGEGAIQFFKASLFFGPANHILNTLEEAPLLVHYLPTLMMVAGFVVALYLYILAPGTADAWARALPGLYRFLLNKWYFDELYGAIFVRPAFWLGRLFWKGGDQGTIDRLGPDGVAARVIDVTHRVVRLQSGYLYHYAFAMLVGVAALITYYLAWGLR
ncbi:MAG TPA: NADH-quinone oxidoreductase subunit L [Methylovirgula sp.]|nr:NADH-quinone oxidoreductase subunit L [Methylovirgula sp.]